MLQSTLPGHVCANTSSRNVCAIVLSYTREIPPPGGAPEPSPKSNKAPRAIGVLCESVRCAEMPFTVWSICEHTHPGGLKQYFSDFSGRAGEYLQRSSSSSSSAVSRRRARCNCVRMCTVRDCHAYTLCRCTYFQDMLWMTTTLVNFSRSTTLYFSCEYCQQPRE